MMTGANNGASDFLFHAQRVGTVAVCICTYRRPSQLARLLQAFKEMPRQADLTFVIVDNDGSDPKIRELVQVFGSASGATVTYLVETKPGLSAARNAAFRAARKAGAYTLALLDDDEWPSSAWLSMLLETRCTTGAPIVGGPVRPVFQPGKEPPEKYRWLWSVQEGRIRGATHVYCTCNCLIDLAAVDFLGDEPFAQEFGFTGGEDVVFFRRLRAAGIEMAWSEKAIVFEDIPAERGTFSWLLRRWYRLGNIGVKCESAAPLGERVGPFAKTIFLALRLLIYPLVNPQVLKLPWLWLLEAERVRGRLASHAGFVVLQYARNAAQQQ